MSITKHEISWAGFKFSRSEVKGFSREDGIFYLYFSENKKIKLGSEEKSWPFDYNSPNDPPALPHLICGNYRFLPEHVLGYYSENPDAPTIQVWTPLGEFTILRSLPQTQSVMAIKSAFRDSVAGDWIAAYTLHQTDPFSS